MMKSKKSNNLSILKYALVIPVVAISIVATSNSNLISDNAPIPIQEGEKVYTVVDKMPEFKGGMEKLMIYLGDNVKYPEEAEKNKTGGKVYVEFVVGKKGEINDVKILKSADALLDAEAIRVVKLMPAWNPGENKGKVVKVKLTLPINFRF